MTTRSNLGHEPGFQLGVNAAEDDEISSDDGIADESLSSWYPETRMSHKMVIEAKCKEMERFQKDEGVSCCCQGIHGEGRRGRDDKQVKIPKAGVNPPSPRPSPSPLSHVCSMLAPLTFLNVKKDGLFFFFIFFLVTGGFIFYFLFFSRHLRSSFRHLSQIMNSKR